MSTISRYAWRKLSAARWGDAWLERLTFLGPGRAMIVEFPNAKTVRVEAHGLTEKEAKDLTTQFGGKATPMKYELPPEPEPRPPIRVRKALVVFSSEAEWQAAPVGPKAPASMYIPAGMAFGTGEHATTATCLRLLADWAQARQGEPWEALDLGTGTGILAIAAAKLGATAVEATDFDPHAVRTAKENVRQNATRKVKVKRGDVRTWEVPRQWPVVIANLFSGLLCEVAPKLAQAVAPGGIFIFSGVLRTQEAEVLAALAKAGLEPDRIVRKGKWIAGTALPVAPKSRRRASPSRPRS